MHLATPFITQFEPIQSGLYLMDSVRDLKYQNALEKLRIRFDAKHSFTLTKRDHTCCHQFGFYIPADRDDLESVLVNHIPLLQSFIHFFETEMAKVIQEMHKQAIDLKLELGPIYNQKGVEFPKFSLDQSKLSDFFEEIGATDDFLSHYRLSKGEIACVKLLLNGNTAPEMAKLLHRSCRTIEHRLESIKEKLKCKTKSELISRLQKMKDLEAHLLMAERSQNLYQQLTRRA